MSNNNHIELILFEKYSREDLQQENLITWLTTTVQSAIERQNARIKKMSLIILEDTPSICMSWNAILVLCWWTTWKFHKTSITNYETKNFICFSDGIDHYGCSIFYLGFSKPWLGSWFYSRLDQIMDNRFFCCPSGYTTAVSKSAAVGFSVMQITPY